VRIIQHTRQSLNFHLRTGPPSGRGDLSSTPAQRQVPATFQYFVSLAPAASSLSLRESIISGTGASSGQKLKFGPTGHHHPRSSSLLEVVSCEDVQFCLHHLNCVKMATLQFHLQWRNTEIRVDGGEKGSARRCVRCRVLLSPKFGAKSSHIFTQSVSTSFWCHRRPDKRTSA
jgi:hypothetical protein